MYNPDVTAAAVEETNRRRAALDKPLQPLVYHSVEEIENATAHFDALMDADRGLTRNLTPDEIAFIDNERNLCALDFTYYLHYFWIVNWRKEPERFTPNVAQRMMIEIWGDLEREGRAIHILQLKARRLGVSTLSEAAVAHRVQFHAFTNAVVASADPTKSVVMADMIDFAWKRMPWWLMPKATKHKNYMPVEFGEIETGLTIQAGNQFNGVARGATPNVYHVSEIAEWVEAESLVDASLLRAIIDDPNVLGMIEGTGEGKFTYFYNTWQRAKKEWPARRGRQMPVFLPWYCGTDIYPSPAWLRSQPIPRNWTPSDRTLNHAEKARQYVLANPLLFKHLAKNDPDWQMSRAQMWYREAEYESAKEAKTLNRFLSEMAGDDFEAFQSQNIAIIDPEVIVNYRERTRQPKAVYTIIGPDIPPQLVTPRRQWDTTRAPVTVDLRSVLPNMPPEKAKYQLVPVQFTGYDSFDPDLKLLIWEMPNEDGPYSYGVGVDCGEGVQQDRSVIEVLRESTPYREPGQVAEWATDRATAFQMWPMAMVIGVLYSSYSPGAQRRVQSKMCIEAWTNGAALQMEIKKRGWSNFHAWQYNDTRKVKPDSQVNRVGIYTNQWFRSQMMDMLLTSLGEESLDLPSPYLVDELETLERIAGQKKIAAQYGMHDDRVMSLGFPLFSLHQNKPPSKQFERKRVSYVPGLEEDYVAYPVWQPPAQASSFNAAPSQQITRSGRGRVTGLSRLYNGQMPKGYR